MRELRRQGLAILSVELGDRGSAVGEADMGDRRRARLARLLAVASLILPHLFHDGA